MESIDEVVELDAYRQYEIAAESALSEDEIRLLRARTNGHLIGCFVRNSCPAT